MDYSRFDRYTLSEMYAIADANIGQWDAMPEERKFWLDKLHAIWAELNRKRSEYYDEDPYFSRAVRGPGRSAPVAPNPDDAPRQLQAGVPEVHPSVRERVGALHGSTTAGASQLKWLWSAADKEPDVGQLE